MACTRPLMLEALKVSSFHAPCSGCPHVAKLWQKTNRRQVPPCDCVIALDATVGLWLNPALPQLTDVVFLRPVADEPSGVLQTGSKGPL